MKLDLGNGLSAELRDNEIRAVEFGTISVKLLLLCNLFFVVSRQFEWLSSTCLIFMKINKILKSDMFGPIWTILDKFGQVYTSLDMVIHVYQSLDKFGQVWTSL